VKILLDKGTLHGETKFNWKYCSKDPVQYENLNIDRLQKWNIMSANLTILWKLIEQRDDFTDEDLDKLHIMCNNFMCQWMDLLGTDHMTNYIHIIGSSHPTYFAAKYWNLYRYSQQGWESLNQLLKHYYFNNTNHGGAAGNGGKSNAGLYTYGVISGDHCRPLMLLRQRSIMWKLGFGDQYFEDKVTIAKYDAIHMMEDNEITEQDIKAKGDSFTMYGIL
jgi:hypothetical protein